MRPDRGASAVRRIRRLSPLAWSLVVCLRLTGPAMSAESPPKSIDLKINNAVTSIARRADGHGFVVSFINCKIAYLDHDGALQSQQEIAGCLRLFTIHVAPNQPRETVTASIYTGHAVVLSGGNITKVKTHEAAVTDVFLAFGGLLTAADDGSVVLSSADGQTVRRQLASGQGVARVLLPDLTAPASSPAFFQSFDSGNVAAVSGSITNLFAMGVGRINGLALSADRTTLYAGGFNGRLRKVTLATGETRDVFSGGIDINAIAPDEAASRLALAIEDGRLVVLDLKSEATLFDSPVTKAGLTAVAFDVGERRVLVGDEKGLLYMVDLPAAAASP